MLKGTAFGTERYCSTFFFILSTFFQNAFRTENAAPTGCKRNPVLSTFDLVLFFFFLQAKKTQPKKKPINATLSTAFFFSLKFDFKINFDAKKLPAWYK